MITKTQQIGQVAVDSGQIMIIDPCYINADFCKEFSPDGTESNAPQKESYKMDYDGCCNATLSNKGYGPLGNEYVNQLAIACGTLHGDGVYPVYAEINEDGRVKSLTIDFDPRSDSDDDLCDYCGQDVNYDCRCDDEEDADA